MKKNILSYTHALFAILLAALFIYAGVKKFIPKDRPTNPKAKKEIIKAVETNNFDRPISFRLTVKMLSTSGFLKFVGILQVLSGLLILLPRTRLAGLIFLLPLTLVIFSLHVFMDNRMDENIETGLFFLINLVLMLFYLKKLGPLIHAKL